MEQYLRDKDFLTELCSQREREVFARVTALNLDDLPLEQIEGKVTNGSINIDGASAVRRTCSLSMVTESLDINEYYWGLKTKIKIEIGLKNNLKKYQNHTIIWFPMGIYLISTFSLSQSTTGITINIGGKDKMCILNGEMGGILMAPTDFGKMETYDEAGNRTVTKIPVKQIIGDMIHQYGNEPYSKIFIEDIEDFGLNLQNWRGADPCYFYLQSLEAGGRTPIQISLNPDDLVLIKEDDQTMAATLRQLENVDQQKYFAGGGNSLTNELATVPVYYYKGPLDQQPHVNSEGNIVASTDENENWMANWSDSAAFVKKVDYGDTVGYTITELVYPEDLIANAGETITSVLDKIKAMLGDFEYFYDIDGNFIFRKQKAYKETYSAQNIFDLETNKTITDGENTYDNSMFLIGAADDSIDFKFDNLELITNISNNPAIGNVKNDFTVWGNRKGANGAQIPIHMRYAIDKKPEEYHSIEITPSRADMLLRCYPELFPMQEGEIGTMAVSRLMAAHRAGDYYYRIPERMKKQVVAYREMYLKPYFEWFKKGLTDQERIKLENFIKLDGETTIRLDGVNEITLYTTQDCEQFENDLLDLNSYVQLTFNGIKYGSEEEDSDSSTSIEYNYYPLINSLRTMDDYITTRHLRTLPIWYRGEWHSRFFLNAMHGLKQFAQSYLDVRNNLYDWRELIYQMAKDYRSFNQIGEFSAWLEEANPYTCVAGKTGYEQYYIDMEGFWRQIYDKSWHDVKWNDELKEGRIYCLRDVSDNPEDSNILQYNTKNLFTTIKKTVDDEEIEIKAKVPDIDIYTLGSENGKNHYTKIGKLYDIIENDYKIMEPIIQRYLIDEWQETHPEATWRLFGLTKNGSNFLEQNTLYLQDPHAQKRDEVTGKFSTASNLEDQLYTTLRPYYHKGEYNDSKNSLGELTYLSNSKEPLWTGVGSDAETFYKALIDVDTKDLNYLDAFRIYYGSGPKQDGLSKEEVKDKLLELGKTFELLKNKTETNEVTLCQMGLIALVIQKENLFSNFSLDGYKSIVKEYFLKCLGEYAYGYRIGMNNESYLNSSFNPALALKDSANNCFFQGLDCLAKKCLGLENYISLFNEDDFEAYKPANNNLNAIILFSKLFSELGNLNGDKKLDIEDFKAFINHLLEKKTGEEVGAQYKNHYTKYICFGSTEKPQLNHYLKELYFRTTNDSTIKGALGKDVYHSQLFALIINEVFFDVIKEFYSTWDKYPFLWSQILKQLFTNKLSLLGITSNGTDVYNKKTEYEELIERIEQEELIEETEQEELIEGIKYEELIEGTERAVRNYLYPFFDLDKNGAFGLMDVQELIKIATKQTSVDSLSKESRELFSFATDFSILPFNLVRFVYFMYILNIATLTDEQISDIKNRQNTDNDKNKLRSLFSANTLKTYGGLGTIVGLWILTLTPYAIGAVKSSNMLKNTPYYVRMKIEQWSYGCANDLFLDQVKILFNETQSNSAFQIQCKEASTEEEYNTSEEIMANYVYRNIPNPISDYEYYVASQLVPQDSTKGDVDKDGKITAKDARLALKLARNMYVSHGQLDRAKKEMAGAKAAAEKEG